MPSSSMVQNMVGGRSLTTTSFQTPMSKRVPPVLIGTMSFEAIGHELIGQTGGAFSPGLTYPAASRVLAYPFQLADPFLVRKVWWANGTTATTDSCDVGVYNEAGTTLLVSGGSTAIAGANILQEKDCTDTLLVPGRYWCAFVQGGTTATTNMTNSAAVILRNAGCAQMTGSGSTLGSTFTAAAVAGTGMPLCGIASRTVVA